VILPLSVQTSEDQLDMFEESCKRVKVLTVMTAKKPVINLASQVTLPSVSQPFTAVRVSPTETWIIHH
jgi:hypothetical protein